MGNESVEEETGRITIRHHPHVTLICLAALFLLIGGGILFDLAVEGNKANEGGNLYSFLSFDRLFQFFVSLVLLRWGAIIAFRRFSIVFDGMSRQVEKIYSWGPIKSRSIFNMSDIKEIVLVSRLEEFQKLSGDIEQSGRLTEAAKKSYRLKILTNKNPPLWIPILSGRPLEEMRKLGKKASSLINIKFLDKTLSTPPEKLGPL